MRRIEGTSLPLQVQRNLSINQRTCLAFAVRPCKVVSARVQTFQLGSTTAGSTTIVGVDRTLGKHWGFFLAGADTTLKTKNEFRTDIQLKLEDADTRQSDFFSVALPFEATFTIDPGDDLAVFLAIGGLAKPSRDDFALSNWTPFAAQNQATQQVIPLGPLPSFEGPTTAFTAVLYILGLLWFVLWLGLSVAYCVENDNGPAGLLGAGFGLLGLILMSQAGGAIDKASVERQLADAAHNAREVTHSNAPPCESSCHT